MSPTFPKARTDWSTSAQLPAQCRLVRLRRRCNGCAPYAWRRLQSAVYMTIQATDHHVARRGFRTRFGCQTRLGMRRSVQWPSPHPQRRTHQHHQYGRSQPGIISEPLPPRRKTLLLAPRVVVACCSTASLAQSTTLSRAAQAAPSAAEDTVRLTDEQCWAILDSNAPESDALARGEMSGSKRARRGIHGEIGAMVRLHADDYYRIDAPPQNRGRTTSSDAIVHPAHSIGLYALSL